MTKGSTDRERLNFEKFFRQLSEIAQSLHNKEQRTAREGLSEEELAVFDLLTKPNVELTAKERVQVKGVARELPATLKQERLVLDRRRKQLTRASVRLTIAQQLDELPRVFPKALYQEKVAQVYEHVYDSYWGEGRSVYGEAAA